MFKIAHVTPNATPSATVVAVDGAPMNSPDAVTATLVPHAHDAVAATLVPPPADATAWLCDDLGLPQGLAESVLESCAEFEERIWLIDNSGSMATSDGHRLARAPGGEPRLVGCSRWEELRAALAWHARVAATLRSPTTFVCLNAPAGAPGEVRVGLGDADAELAQMALLLESSPRGRTPLCAAMRDVVRRVSARAAALRAAGTKVAVVVASDGCATDGDVELAMRPLRELPVWCVVRLCTDDDGTVDYWNKIDEELELDMDVLDDLVGEAKEVRSGNAWLTYAPELHHLREWGTSQKLIDMLDEKALTVSEIRDFAALVLGRETARNLPHPHADLQGFIEGLKRSLARTPAAWDPIARRPRAWLNAEKIRAAGRRENRREAWAHATGTGVVAECNCTIA